MKCNLSAIFPNKTYNSFVAYTGMSMPWIGGMWGFGRQRAQQEDLRGAEASRRPLSDRCISFRDSLLAHYFMLHLALKLKLRLISFYSLALLLFHRPLHYPLHHSHFLASSNKSPAPQECLNWPIRVTHILMSFPQFSPISPYGIPSIYLRISPHLFDNIFSQIFIKILHENRFRC